jgi:putative membrane protein
MNTDALIRGAAASLIFSTIGILVFVGGFYAVRKMLPFDVHKELEVDQNVAVGLVVSSFILGLAFIVGMSIHG